MFYVLSDSSYVLSGGFNCYKCYQTILSVLSAIRKFLNVSMCFQVLSDSFRCFKCF